MNREIVLLGTGGHSKACVNLLDQLRNYSFSLKGRAEIADYITDTRELTAEEWDTLCAMFNLFLLGIGQIHTAEPRINTVKEVTNRGGSFISLASPSATLSPDARIGEGLFAGHNVVVNPYANIGHFAILNTGCIIEHDATVGDFCHISTGAVINGEAKVGNRCFFGSNAVVLQQVCICDDVVVGAGSVVISNIMEAGVYVGNPARKIR